MILFAIAVYLLGSSYAAPFSPSSSNETNLPPISNLVSFVAGAASDQQCTCVAQRSFWDILWSCLATIFACSWVSVHPNMPLKGESPVKATSRRLELMAWTIIAPELIVTWAIRQWIGAHWLAKEYEKYNWTKTHGHFLQMGGFLLINEKNKEEVLSPERLNALYIEGKIDIPQIPEGEIKDRSKADVLNKTLVLGQTTWFVIQCVARNIQGLIITELELVTVAFAFLHGFMYFLWLDKPLSAQYPIVVRLREEKNAPIIEDRPESVLDTTPYRKRLQQFLKRQMDYVFKTIPYNIHQCLKSSAGWIIQFITSVKPLEMLYDIFVLGPPQAVMMFIKRLDAMVEEDRIPADATRVPTFYAMEAKENENTPLAVTSAIAVVFGAIHCAGWGFQFQTPADAWMWRVSSAIITVIPFAAVVVGVCFSMFLVHSSALHIFKRLLGYVLLAAGGFTVFTLPLYILARFVLLAEALAGMRRLLPGAFDVVEWSDFFPHI
ncbi:hypothetical protein CPC08DRAFT_672510 [Agrocybe pediades]|nr:hypothetical protein CPC08DRAFT_672510 [Agrocybe pediades]